MEFYLNKGHCPFAPVETTLFSITAFKHHLITLLSFTQQSPTLLRTTVIFVLCGVSSVPDSKQVESASVWTLSWLHHSPPVKASRFGAVLDVGVGLDPGRCT